MTDAAELAGLIRDRQPCVVLTGAGISTESGIPDFRSDSGLWADVDPFEVATIDAFRRDPERVWDFYRQRLATHADAEPNAGHHALVELERRGLVAAVITQNVDGLHARAGTTELVEVHGSIGLAVCLVCGTEERVTDVLPTAGLPACRCGGVLKPGVVLFGEMLPAAAIQRAERLARDAELMVVVGSSLEVWPVAGLPLASRSVAIVNRGPTGLDHVADVRIDGSAGETLAAVVAALDG